MAEQGVFVGRERNPWLVFLLSLVTAFLYFFYWLYAVNVEVRRRTGRRVKAELLLVVALLFPLGTAFSMWRTGRNVLALQYEAASTRETRPSLLASLSLLLPVIGHLLFVLSVQRGLNEVWRATREGLSGPALEQEMRCPSCDALFVIAKAPFLPYAVKCPSCAMEGTV